MYRDSAELRISEFVGHPAHAIEFEFGRLAFLDIDIAQNEVVHLVDGSKMCGVHAHSMRKAAGCVKRVSKRKRG